MKYYVVHYTKNIERRKSIETQFKEFGITDVEWIEEYDKEDPFVTEIKEKSGSPLTLGLVSCSLKHFVAMKRMVDQNIKEAVILEDDVVLYPEFKRYKFFHPSGFLRLGIGVGILEKCQPPKGTDKIFIASNPGGSEAQWVSLEFAKAAIENMNFDYSIDFFHMGLLGENLRCMNLCYQTSLIQDETSGQGFFDKEACDNYCKNFSSLKRFRFKGDRVVRASLARTAF